MSSILEFLHDISIEQVVKSLSVVSVELAIAAIIFWILLIWKRIHFSPKDALEEIRILSLPPEERPIDPATAKRVVTAFVKEEDEQKLKDLFLEATHVEIQSGWKDSRKCDS